MPASMSFFLKKKKLRKLELKTDIVEENVDTFKSQQGVIHFIIHILKVNSLIYAMMFKEQNADHEKLNKRMAEDHMRVQNGMRPGDLALPVCPNPLQIKQQREVFYNLILMYMYWLYVNRVLTQLSCIPYWFKAINSN